MNKAPLYFLQTELPFITVIVYSLLYCGIGYILALIFVGFPCTIYESITKKKIDEEKEKKITKIAWVCFSVILNLRLFYELAN